MSAAEILLAVQLEQAGIPFEREFRFHPERRWRADFMVGRFLIEVDGGAYVGGRHTRGVGFEADLEKLNAAAELGFRVLRYSPRQVNDGTAIARIRRILSMEAAA